MLLLKDVQRLKNASLVFITVLKNHRKTYLIGMGAVLMTNLGEVSQAHLIGQLLDVLNHKNSFFGTYYSLSRENDFLFLAVLYTFIHLLMYIGRVGWRWFLGRQTSKSHTWLREIIWDWSRLLPIGTFKQRWTKGHWMNLSSSDTNETKMLFGFVLVGLFDAIFLGGLALISLFKIDYRMSLACFLFFVGMPFFVRWLTDLEVKYYKRGQKFLDQFNELVGHSVETIRLQRLTSTGEKWTQQLLLSAKRVRDSRYKTISTSLLFIPVMSVTKILSYLVLFLWGVGRVRDGHLSVGEFVTFQGLVVLIEGPFSELGFVLSDVRRALSSLERIHNFTQEPMDLALNQRPELPLGNHNVDNVIVELKNLSYQYYDADEVLFKNIDLQLRPGDRLGIKGKIGSGKTTLLELIAGLKGDYLGEVSLFDHDLKKFSQKQLREVISLVGQRPFIFSGTIKSNICLDRDYSEEEIWQSLELAQMANDVRGMAQGLDTTIGEWGINLSGGQKQRLTLTRSLIRRPKILLLDDCLSAVDAVTEEKILSGLNGQLLGQCIVWVAHRDSTLKYCHNVWEFDRGTS